MFEAINVYGEERKEVWNVSFAEQLSLAAPKA